MKIGEKIYTPAQASQMLGGLLSPRNLTDRAAAGKIPHLGGRRVGAGKIMFAESHLQDIVRMLEYVPEQDQEEYPTPATHLDAFQLRQTGRSAAAHAKKIAA